MSMMRRNKGWRTTPALEQGRIKKCVRDCPTTILSPKEVIMEALMRHGDDVVMSWSGGRCSTAALYIATQIDPDIRVNFTNTGVEFPETLEFVEMLTDEWSLNLEVLKPETTFWESVKQYGWPMIRRSWKTAKNYKQLYKTGRPMCCLLLKEEPLKRAGIVASITGIRACESRMRMFTIAQRGQYYWVKTYKRYHYHPIALWPTEQLLKFHEEHEIPQNKVYEMGQERCGCWPCTGYIGWRESLNTSHHEMYLTLMRMKGEPTLWEYMDQEGCQQGGIEV